MARQSLAMQTVHRFTMSELSLEDLELKFADELADADRWFALVVGRWHRSGYLMGLGMAHAHDSCPAKNDRQIATWSTVCRYVSGIPTSFSSHVVFVFFFNDCSPWLTRPVIMGR